MSDLVSLLPENATALERDLEQVTAGVARIDPEFEWLWDPDRIPENLLAYLAWALSVDVWNSRWPAGAKRKAIANAVAIHRIKGTRAAVEQAVASVGAKALIEEWWETGGTPHTFRVTALASEQFEDDDAPVLDSRLIDRVTDAIMGAKPVREHFDLSIGASFGTGLGACVQTHAASVARGVSSVSGPAPKRAATLGLSVRRTAVMVVRATSEIGATP